MVLKNVKNKYKGKLALQIMFVNENKNFVQSIADCVRIINPDEVEINTPLRPCGVKPLPKIEIENVEKYFTGLNIVSVYTAPRKRVTTLSNKDTLVRRGKE